MENKPFCSWKADERIFLWMCSVLIFNIVPHQTWWISIIRFSFDRLTFPSKKRLPRNVSDGLFQMHWSSWSKGTTCGMLKRVTRIPWWFGKQTDLHLVFCLNELHKQILGINETGDLMPLYHENTASRKTLIWDLMSWLLISTPLLIS